MNFSFSYLVSQPRESVFRVMRDQVASMFAQKLLHNVKDFRVVSAETRAGGKMEVVNDWRPLVEVPFVFRSFIPTDRIGWRETALYDPETCSVTWSTQSFLFREATSCQGKTNFIALSPEKTSAAVLGALEIDTQKTLVPGMFKHKLESYVVDMMQANFQRFFQAVDLFLRLEGSQSAVASVSD